ncbi:MAG TPA: nuclear transport factor 2 family protein [Pyrinomonadaceae bacterium]|nr:nuclear transport factor 2 family protein [Pyrinomonadaceae bacterium]
MVLASLAFGFTLAFLWVGLEARSIQPASTISLLDSDKAQDGLAGSVQHVRTETAQLYSKSGQMVEGPRQLMAVAAYDQKGGRLESAVYLTSGSSYNGRQEYEYDDKGNIVAMTIRGPDNSILNRESYKYEFDALGNWTKMTTLKAASESGREAPHPAEVTYRNITYYYDKNLAATLEQNPPQSVESKGESSPASSGRSNEELPAAFTELSRALDEWVRATNARDVDKMMTFYGPKLLFYYRARSTTDEAVRKDKVRSFERAELIDVRAGAPEITLDRDGQTATMRFRKEYIVKIKDRVRSGEVLQELRWQRTDDGWRIIGERDAREIR